LTSVTTLLAIMKYLSRPKNAAVKDIDIVIDIADILDHKYRYCIDISKWDIDPPLDRTHLLGQLGSGVWISASSFHIFSRRGLVSDCNISRGSSHAFQTFSDG